MSIILALKIQKGKTVLRGHDHFWSVIMDRHARGETFSPRDIDGASNGHDPAVRDFVRRLERAGLLEVVKKASSHRETQYRPTVIQSRAPRVRRDGSMIESQPGTRCMWNLIRGPMGRQGFTFRDLVNWAATDETKISVETAKAYIKTLKKAGYLQVLHAGKPGAPATLRLIPSMNTGANAPMILRTKLVYDPNRDEVMGPAEAEEAQA